MTGFLFGVLFTLSFVWFAELRRLDAKHPWLKPRRTKTRRELFVEVLVLSAEGWALIWSRLRRPARSVL